MYAPAFCRMVYAVAAILKCNRGATPLTLRRFAGSNYEKLLWKTDRCFGETLLKHLPESVREVDVGDTECCFPKGQVDRLKIRAPVCQDDGDHQDERGGGAGFTDGGGARFTDGGGHNDDDHTHRNHTHTLLHEFLDLLVKTAIILGIVLLLLLHKKLLGVIKRWKESIGRSPTAESPARQVPSAPAHSRGTPPIPPRPPAPHRPTGGEETPNNDGTPDDYFPATHRSRATPPLSPGPRPPTRPFVLPVRLFQRSSRRRQGLNATRGGPLRRGLLASVTESSSSSSGADKPWNERPPDKMRRKGCRILDLKHFSNEVVWCAVRLNVPTIKGLLQQHGMPVPDESMPLDRKCDHLAALLERVDVDLLALVRQRQQEKRAEKRGGKQSSHRRSSVVASDEEYESRIEEAEEDGDDAIHT
ncbi:MAG: hypothetical protein GY738_11000 [Pseudoalteromonas sp.]|nr:hypothetical protein [Pseudoalteromonas sp.]